jgi:hypothetical protein
MKRITDKMRLEFIMSQTVLTGIGHRYVHENGPFTRWQATLDAADDGNILTRKVIDAAIRSSRARKTRRR